ncbi:MAG: V-type ATP synthase subunit D [Clostridia bacterium]|nr:V-type ATP synthase subunit D [Clostridia bacterium]
MAVMNVNPTRMEMAKLKKKLATARRGHRLLKDKRDELMRGFLELVRENLSLRNEVEAAIKSANAHMAIAGSLMSPVQLETALMMPKQSVSLDVGEKNVMSVRIPVFRPKFRVTDEKDVFSYGFAFTSSELDGAVSELGAVFEKMVRLAEVEKSCQLMSAEIERTRRRVNALEHVMIPRYEETIRFIAMKLSENERSTTVRLMKSKDLMIKQKIEKDRENGKAQ